jgi:para-aminobenzoate synthetase / 4-amino-4-deoxychorismate lyase
MQQTGLSGLFALLDDALDGAGGAGKRSRLYEGYVHQRECHNPAELDVFWQQVRADQRSGLNAVVLADYEWGVRLQGLTAGPSAQSSSADAALRVLFFSTVQHLSSREVDAWLRDRDQRSLDPRGGATASTEPTVAGTLDWSSEVDEGSYTEGIRAIQRAIRDGETYQVNYTHRLLGTAFGSPVGLYRRLRARQPVAFGALIALPDDRWVLSLSPELFLQVKGRQVTAKPMKGTAARSDDAVTDAAAARFLQTDAKNRAENLMIVDLLRNDLGRLAQTGTVNVPHLFEVEACGRVWQMTSTIQATLRNEVDWPALWRATFPCGSITGAPKRKTLEKISDLERSPRGLYCGAIGWLDAPALESGLGDSTLSVAIRTLILSGSNAAGSREVTLGVGSGVVMDSDAAGEFAECAIKTGFARNVDPGFTLFETVRCVEGKTPLWSRHVERLSTSARRLGFALDLQELDAHREHAIASGAWAGAWRMRFDLDVHGRITVRTYPLLPLEAASVTLGLSGHTVARGRALAEFKTSDRALYDDMVQQAQAQGHFDLLLFSSEGFLLEGGRSNVLVHLPSEGWVTPPVSDGLLPGVMRAELLADTALRVTERSVHRSELNAAQAWLVCNALRGAVPATVPELSY